MFGSVEKQVSWLPFQYKQCTKEKKESINEMLLMETRCIIPMGLDRIACCTEWCMQQGIIPIIITIYPRVFSCIGEGRRKSTVKSNVLKCPSVLWFNNAAIKGKLLPYDAVFCLLALMELYFCWQFWPFPVSCQKCSTALLMGATVGAWTSFSSVAKTDIFFTLAIVLDINSS